jgi:hypothetical protein
MSLLASAIYQKPGLVRDVRNREVLFWFLIKIIIRDVRNIMAQQIKENRSGGWNEFPWDLAKTEREVSGSK